jgi:hypothetical protein
MPKEVDAITKLYDFILWIIPKLEKKIIECPLRNLIESVE